MIVYKITNTINNKVYFGVTKCSLSKRWNEHKSKSKSSKSHLAKSINKYGFDKFNIEIVANCKSEDEMYSLEISLIKKNKSNNPKYGYNNSLGGEISSFGKKLNDQHRMRISDYQKKRVRKPWPDHVKEKMSLSAKGRDMSVQIKASAISRKGKLPHNAISVDMTTLEGSFIKSFKSFKEAAAYVGGSISAFSMLKKGSLKTYKGHKWKFQN